MKWDKSALLKELREAKGWSQKQLAEASGLSQQAIAHWELGDREPSATNLFALCRALSVSCERFATEGGEPVEPAPRQPRGRPRADTETTAKPESTDVKPAAEKAKNKRGKK